MSCMGTTWRKSWNSTSSSSFHCQYDPLSYAKNYDSTAFGLTSYDDDDDDDDDSYHFSRSFSSRFVRSASSFSLDLNSRFIYIL